MGEIGHPAPVKLFVGVLTSRPGLLELVETRLTSAFGAIDLRSDRFPFDSTDYYDAEMGTPIERAFLGFRTLIDAATLPGIKLLTNRLEADLAAEAPVARPVNLDPGYIEAAKVVLASTKNFYHRILLGSGIYGEVTLALQGGRWQPFPWTFPDFRSGRYDGFFLDLRKRYREQLKTDA